MPNLEVGPYEISIKLGSGTFGDVNLACHRLGKTYVAVKSFRTNAEMDNQTRTVEFKSKITKEIHISQSLMHPNIIRVYDVIEATNEFRIVMEYAKNAELHDFIISRPRDEAVLRSIFQQLISAVAFCHHRNIAHRDLKAENILLDEFDTVKVVDFGLSTIIDDGSFLRTSCGSPDCAAPELINGLPYSGPLADIWSCGVTLYGLFAGAGPFQAPTVHGVFKKIRTGHYEIPPQTPPLVQHLIARMLESNMCARIRMDDIRRHPWFTMSLPEYLTQPLEKQCTYDESEVNIDVARKVFGLVVEYVASNPAHTNMLSINKMIRYIEHTGFKGILKAIESDTPNDIQGMYLMLVERQKSCEVADQIQLSITEPDLSLDIETNMTSDTGYFRDQLRTPRGRNTSSTFTRPRSVNVSQSSQYSYWDPTDPQAETVEEGTLNGQSSVSGTLLDFDRLDSSAINIHPHDIQRLRWLLGVTTVDDPKKIIQKLCLVIEELGCEFYVDYRRSYTIYVRWRKQDGIENYVYLSVQLYQIWTPPGQETEGRKACHLLDFLRCGSISSSVRFLQLCNMIIYRLRDANFS